MIEDDSKVGCVQVVYPEQGVHYKEFDDVSVFYLLLKGRLSHSLVFVYIWWR